MREKRTGITLFFSIIELFPLQVRFLFRKYFRKNTATICWPPHKVTALQVVRTSFLGPRPHLFPTPPPPTPTPDNYFQVKPLGPSWYLPRDSTIPYHKVVGKFTLGLRVQWWNASWVLTKCMRALKKNIPFCSLPQRRKQKNCCSQSPPPPRPLPHWMPIGPWSFSAYYNTIHSLCHYFFNSNLNIFKAAP